MSSASCDCKSYEERDNQSPKPDAEMARVRAEFDRVMNTPSPNPRYEGRTPLEIVKVLLSAAKKKIEEK